MAHYKRLWRHGSPTGGGTAKGAVRRWLRDHANYAGDDCLIWPFAKNSLGYAIVDKKLGSGFGPRVMCQMAHGDPPTPDHEAAHSCGNGRLGCMNPRHLRWLTHAENMSETLVHGTHNRGERNGQAKLSEHAVREIRRLAGIVPQLDLAERYDITSSHVSSIQSGDRWGWLNDS